MEPIIPKNKAQGAPLEITRPTTYQRVQAAVLGKSIVWAAKSAAKGLIKIDMRGKEHIQTCLEAGRPIVFAGWHGDNFLAMCAYYKEVRHLTKGAILVPDSLNGTIMQQIGRELDLEVIQIKPGSGPTGWARATVSIIRMLRNGSSVLLSPDGPSGPARHVKPGICVIAQQAKAFIIPASAAISSGLQLRGRWDDHLIPYPFSKAVVRFGPPIDSVPPEGEKPTEAQLQAQIAKALNIGKSEAERMSRAGTSTDEAAK